MTASRETKALLCRRWVHSHEEDSAAEQVFRPADYAFPPSRGREAFECQSDGSLRADRPGATDKTASSSGRWEWREPRSVLLFRAGAASPFRVLEIVDLTSERLVVRRQKG